MHDMVHVLSKRVFFILISVMRMSHSDQNLAQLVSEKSDCLVPISDCDIMSD